MLKPVLVLPLTLCAVVSISAALKICDKSTYFYGPLTSDDKESIRDATLKLLIDKNSKVTHLEFGYRGEGLKPTANIFGLRSYLTQTDIAKAQVTEGPNGRVLVIKFKMGRENKNSTINQIEVPLTTSGYRNGLDPIIFMTIKGGAEPKAHFHTYPPYTKFDEVGIPGLPSLVRGYRSDKSESLEKIVHVVLRQKIEDRARYVKEKFRSLVTEGIFTAEESRIYREIVMKRVAGA